MEAPRHEPYYYLLVLCLPLVIAALVRATVLPVQTISLAAAPSLAGQVSQSLGPNSNGVLPVYGTDFTLSTRYFEGDSWAVTKINPVDGNADSAVLVFKKTDRIYLPALGPGSGFSLTQLSALPGDVAAYVQSLTSVTSQPQ